MTQLTFADQVYMLKMFSYLVLFLYQMQLRQKRDTHHLILSINILIFVVFVGDNITN